jgi:hypothetical protein
MPMADLWSKVRKLGDTPPAPGGDTPALPSGAAGV